MTYNILLSHNKSFKNLSHSKNSSVNNSQKENSILQHNHLQQAQTLREGSFCMLALNFSEINFYVHFLKYNMNNVINTCKTLSSDKINFQNNHIHSSDLYSATKMQNWFFNECV